MVAIKTTVIGNGSQMDESKGGRTTDMPSRNTDTLRLGQPVPSSVAGVQQLRRMGRNFGIKTSKAMY